MLDVVAKLINLERLLGLISPLESWISHSCKIGWKRGKFNIVPMAQPLNETPIYRNKVSLYFETLKILFQLREMSRVSGLILLVSLDRDEQVKSFILHSYLLFSTFYQPWKTWCLKCCLKDVVSSGLVWQSVIVHSESVMPVRRTGSQLCIRGFIY